MLKWSVVITQARAEKLQDVIIHRNKMIPMVYDEVNHSIMYIIPMQDESNSSMLSDEDWVYCKDGKKHGKIPALVMPSVMNLFGGEDAIRKAGYHKHSCVFHDFLNNEYWFGNKIGFENSTEEYDRRIAKKILPADIEFLLSL